MHSLLKGVSRSCGCLSREVSAENGRSRVKQAIRAGDRFGRWTVIDPTERSAVLCRCDCGSERTVFAGNLLMRRSSSCGCFKSERSRERGRANRKHGLSGHPLYAVWKKMIHRCTNEHDHDWARYGGRGIRVHEPWLHVTTFVEQVESEIGLPDQGMTLDRIDNDRNYEPGNIRWSSRRGQAANRNSRGTLRSAAVNSGEVRKRVKLTPQQAAEIVSLYESGASQTALAKQFGISQPHVSRIVRGV